MRYISDLKDGSSVKDIYLCKKRQSLVTRAGKAYETLTFQDKTGTIDAKIWDPDSMGIGEFGEMDYVDTCSSMSAARDSATKGSMTLPIICRFPNGMSMTCTRRS